LIIETAIGPIDLVGRFVASELVPEGHCLLLGPADATGMRSPIWYGPINQISDEHFLQAEQTVVHPVTYARIEQAVAKREEGIPYEPAPAPHE
jgi:hypothetical protein